MKVVDDDVIDAEAVTVRPVVKPEPPKAAGRLTRPAPETEPVNSAAEVKPDAKTQKPAERPVETAAQPAVASTAKPQKPASKIADAKIFVTPRAPDDPGPEEGETTEEEPYPKRVFRAVN